MPQMTDPMNALVSFQEVITAGGLQLQRGVLDRDVFLHVDRPEESVRFTYTRIEKGTVTALAMFVHVGRHKGIPCFAVGYAVPEKLRSQGRAKGILAAGLAELKRGLIENGSFYINAVVGNDNIASQQVSAAIISQTPEPIIDDVSGLPALSYYKKIEA